MTSEQIINKLKHYINDDKALKRKTNAAYEYVAQNCGYDNGVRLFNNNISGIITSGTNKLLNEVNESCIIYDLQEKT